MPDEIDLLRAFREEIPGPSTGAWTRARAAIDAARSQEDPPGIKNAQPRGGRRLLAVAVAAGVAAAVGALLAVLLPGPPTAGPGSEQQIQDAAYVTRVERALASSRRDDVVEYARTVLPPGSRVQLQKGDMSSGPGVSSPLNVAVTITWSYQGASTTYGFAPGGRRVFAAETTGAAGGRELAVLDGDRTWWRAATPAPAGRQAPQTCGPGIRIGAGGWPAFIRYELGCGELQVRHPLEDAGTVKPGRQRVDGVATVELTGGNGSMLWVSPATYLPVRVIVGGRQPTQIDFRWLAPTRANLAGLSVPVPAGYRQVPPP